MIGLHRSQCELAIPRFLLLSTFFLFLFFKPIFFFEEKSFSFRSPTKKFFFKNEFLFARVAFQRQFFFTLVHCPISRRYFLIFLFFLNCSVHYFFVTQNTNFSFTKTILFYYFFNAKKAPVISKQNEKSPCSPDQSRLLNELKNIIVKTDMYNAVL